MAIYEAGVCECGFHSSLTHDADNYFTLEDRVCPVCRGVARHSRVREASDQATLKQIGEKAPPGTPRPGDGRRTFVRQMTPDEVEKRASSRGR